MGLKELAYATNDLKDVQYPWFGVFLFNEILQIDWDETELVRIIRLAQYLDGSYRVKHNSVYFAKLDIIQRTLAKGNDVAMVDFWLHWMTCNIAP